MILPPTVGTWSSLFRLYLILGTAAAILAISFFIFNLIRKPKSERPRAISTAAKRKARIYTLVLALMTITVLASVEIETFRSMSLVTLPSDRSNALTVKVIGQQFFWTFIYPNNYSSVGNLTVPINRVIILNITSRDVFHSLAILELNVAKDAIPGKYNALSFLVPAPANYTIFCKEFCGSGHTSMTATLKAVDATTFDTWYAKQRG